MVVADRYKALLHIVKGLFYWGYFFNLNFIFSCKEYCEPFL